MQLLRICLHLKTYRIPFLFLTLNLRNDPEFNLECSCLKAYFGFSVQNASINTPKHLVFKQLKSSDRLCFGGVHQRRFQCALSSTIQYYLTIDEIYLYLMEIHH